MHTSYPIDTLHWHFCFSKIGKQKISLVCNWDDPSPANESVRPMQLHLLFKGPSAGDLYFMQITDCQWLNNFEEPRLMFFSVINNNTASLFCSSWKVQSNHCTLWFEGIRLPTRWPLRTGVPRRLPSSARRVCAQIKHQDWTDTGEFWNPSWYVHWSGSGTCQNLTMTDREGFLRHLYAARYLQRMETAFGIPNKLYQDSNVGKRWYTVEILGLKEKRIRHWHLGTEFSMFK